MSPEGAMVVVSPQGETRVRACGVRLMMVFMVNILSALRGK
jgi:hypothetical protein